MMRIIFAIFVAILVVLASAANNYAQRGGRGGGGGGGGRPAGGFTAPASPAATSTAASSTHSSGVGPGGGTYQSGQKSGSYTTQGGSTINYKGAGAGGTTAGGTTGGKYVGGVQVTTPGGQTTTKVGSGGAATGPGGVTGGGKQSVTKTTGPAGTGASASRSGIAVGPNGAVAGKSGIAVGPGGVVVGHSAATVGPGGVAVGRSATAVTANGTYHRSAVAVSGQGAYVRTACTPYHSCFTRSWYASYPGAWMAAGWAASAAWRAATWSTVATTSGYPEEPVSYDYGSTVVYQGDNVYVNGDPVGTAEEYAQQATAVADAGRKADPPKDEEWTPLGVFAMVQGEEQTSNNIFQLAIDKNGVIRGNYYNALTDSTEPVYGSVDKKTQRAAWTVGDKKKPVYEAGIANLTKNETTMMAHYGKDRSQQYTLFRIEQPPEGDAKKDDSGK